MSVPVARYAITFGLQGCYMPDSHGGAFECTTRRKLADLIRDELRQYDLPAYLFRDVRIRRLWGFIRRYGSSTAHFSLCHGSNVLQFHGLTEQEYADQQGDE
jgi:hypothetical protein